MNTLDFTKIGDAYRIFFNGIHLGGLEAKHGHKFYPANDVHTNAHVFLSEKGNIVAIFYENAQLKITVTE